jgi:hypothetical protein
MGANRNDAYFMINFVEHLRESKNLKSFTHKKELAMYPYLLAR